MGAENPPDTHQTTRETSGAVCGPLRGYRPPTDCPASLADRRALLGDRLRLEGPDAETDGDLAELLEDEGIDLTLALVEDAHGADLARRIARELVVFLRRPGGQSQFSTATTPPPRNDLLRALIESVLADPAADHGLPAMARAAAVSPRHLTRLFHADLGTTPARWVERVRLDHARQLLLDGHSVTSAARHSGFGSDETLRRAFARHLGTTPSEYRERFATASRA